MSYFFGRSIDTRAPGLITLHDSELRRSVL